jgi:ABC-2 type transport system permease protein
MSFSAIGDFFSGIAFLAYFTPWLLLDGGFVLRYGIALLIGSIVFLGVMIAYHSLGFYLGSSEKIADGAFNGLLGGSIYPPSIYEGTFMKPILLIVFPTYFAVFYPYLFAVSNWDLRLLGYSLFGAIVFCGIGITLFQRGIKRYESGNLVMTNV